MTNPWTLVKHPATPAQFQCNANWATYERMAAQDALNEYDHAGVKAPQEIIANAHTMRWVEREYIREAQKARRSQDSAIEKTKASILTSRQAYASQFKS